LNTGHQNREVITIRKIPSDALLQELPRIIQELWDEVTLLWK